MTPYNIVRTVFAAISAVCAFLLAQPDVTLDPIVKVALGAVIVALSVINPNTVTRAVGNE